MTDGNPSLGQEIFDIACLFGDDLHMHYPCRRNPLMGKRPNYEHQPGEPVGSTSGTLNTRYPGLTFGDSTG